MKASEAKQITQRALDGQSGVIGQCVEVALGKIRGAAEQGQSSAANPVPGLPSKQQQVAYQQLRNLGYTVQLHCNQREGDYWEVSW